MSFLQRLYSDYFVEDPEDPRWWTGGFPAGRKTDAGIEVSPEASLGLSTYYACIRNVGEDLAKLPLKVYRRDGRAKTEEIDSPVYSLIHDAPNGEMTAIAWRETMTQWALGWGGGFSEIERDNGARPVAFWPIHPSRVELKRTPGGKLFYRVKAATPGAEPTDLLPEDVLHIHGLGHKGTTGYHLSVLAAQTIGLGLATKKFGSRFFGSGSRLSGYLVHPEKLTKEAKDNVRRLWREAHAGVENALDVAVLAEGMEWKQLGIPPDEAQFLQTRQHQVEEVCRWFRMPPHKVQHLLRSTFNNIEHQGIEYVVDALQAWAVRWEQELKRKCFNDPALFAEHNFNGLLRGDMTKRSMFYRTLWNIGAMSQNDIRAAENQNPIPDGDTYYVPRNMIPSEMAAKGETGEEPETKAPPDDFTRAHAPAFEDALCRVLTKEARALTRAAAKGNRVGREALVDWAAEFYADQPQYLVATLLPVARTYAKLTLGHENIIGTLESFARIIHCPTSRLQIARTDDLKALCEEWVAVRPRAEAIALMDLIRQEQSNV